MLKNMAQNPNDVNLCRPPRLLLRQSYNGYMNWLQNLTSTMPYMVSPGPTASSLAFRATWGCSGGLQEFHDWKNRNKPLFRNAKTQGSETPRVDPQT